MLLFCLARLALVIFASAPPFADSADTLPAPAAEAVDIAGLQARRLFGTRDAAVAGTASGQPVARPEAPIETRLNLRLEGVVVGNPASTGFAMITAGNTTGSYRVGERLPGGGRVVLDAIYPDRVVLENNGSNETLWLYDAGRDAVSTAPTPAAALPAAGQAEGGSYDPVALVRAFRERLANTPAATEFLTLAEIVRISPAQENSRLVGYRLSPGEHLKEFVRLGFRTNDIVTRVNGIELDDIGNLPALYDVMTTAGDVTLTLERDGRPLDLQLSLADLGRID